MSNQFNQVRDFNKYILGIPHRNMGLLNEDELGISIKALNEETIELMEAHQNEDYVGCIDAMIDLVYFAYGVLYKLGIHDPSLFREIFDAVHISNMTKVKGVKSTRQGFDDAADAIKPENWKSPEDRIISILQRYRETVK